MRGWDQLEVDQLERYRRTAYASIFFTFPGVRSETVKKAMDCMLSPCVAVLEGAAANRSFGAVDLTDNLPLLGEIAAARDCEQALIARAADGEELAADEALEAARDLGSQIPKNLDSAR